MYSTTPHPQESPGGSSTTAISPHGTNSRPRTVIELLGPSPSRYQPSSAADSRIGFLDCTDATQNHSLGCSLASPSSTWSTKVTLSRSLDHTPWNSGSRGIGASPLVEAPLPQHFAMADSQSLNLTSDIYQESFINYWTRLDVVTLA